MEGIAVATSLDKLLTTFGVGGTLVIMCIIAFFVIKEVKKAINDLKIHSDKKDEALVARLEKAEKEIMYLSKDAVTKEMLYRETEGWRSEIQLVRTEISKLPFEILKLTRKDEK
ncbi:MAG: hypothetical protein IJR80_09150 [Treponema sp.]|nr:hypothetical protein [Treponema sp.]